VYRPRPAKEFVLCNCGLVKFLRIVLRLHVSAYTHLDYVSLPISSPFKGETDNAHLFQLGNITTLRFNFTWVNSFKTSDSVARYIPLSLLRMYSDSPTCTYLPD